MRLERKEQECDDLKMKLEKLNMGGKEFPLKLKEVSISYVNKGESILNNTEMTFSQTKNEQTSNTNSTNNTIKFKLSDDNNTKTPIIANPTPTNTAQSNNIQKSSALDKIRELKERKNNPSNRINLTGSIIEANNNNLTDNNVNSIEQADIKNPTSTDS
jgi:hypothetical protein